MNIVNKISRHGSKHRYFSSMIISTTLLSSSVFAQATSPQADDVTAAQVFKVSASQDAGTGGGGPWVVESESNWKRGEITAVEVCHGWYVEKMTVFYGGVRGTVLGNPNAGVGCVMWTNEGGGYLKAIHIYSGVYLDAIEFHPSVGKPVRIGGGGGGRSIIEDPNGGAIRTIDAKHGVYLDRVRANFGLPYYIDNMKYDYDALKKQMDSTKPEQIDLQTVDACRSSTPLTQKIIVEKKISDTHSFNFSNTTAISLTTTVEGGFGDVFKASASTNISTAFTVGNSQSTTTESTYRREVDGRANPGEKVHIVTISKRAELDLPYTYDLVHYQNGNKKDVVQRQKFNGVYKGNKAAATDTTQIDYDCKTNQPILAESQPEAPTVQPPAPTVQPVSADKPVVSSTPSNAAGTNSPSVPAASALVSTTPVADLGAIAGSSGKGKTKAVFVDLKWTDTFTGERGFVIERAPSAGKGQDNQCGSFAYAGKATADSTGFRDSTASGKTEYCYQVRAIDAADAPLLPSNVARAKTG